MVRFLVDKEGQERLAPATPQRPASPVTWAKVPPDQAKLSRAAQMPNRPYSFTSARNRPTLSAKGVSDIAEEREPASVPGANSSRVRSNDQRNGSTGRSDGAVLDHERSESEVLISHASKVHIPHNPNGKGPLSTTSARSSGKALFRHEESEVRARPRLGQSPRNTPRQMMTLIGRGGSLEASEDSPRLPSPRRGRQQRLPATSGKPRPTLKDPKRLSAPQSARIASKIENGGAPGTGGIRLVLPPTSTVGSAKDEAAVKQDHSSTKDTRTVSPQHFLQNTSDVGLVSVEIPHSEASGDASKKVLAASTEHLRPTLNYPEGSAARGSSNGNDSVALDSDTIGGSGLPATVNGSTVKDDDAEDVVTLSTKDNQTMIPQPIARDPSEVDFESVEVPHISVEDRSPPFKRNQFRARNDWTKTVDSPLKPRGGLRTQSRIRPKLDAKERKPVLEKKDRDDPIIAISKESFNDTNLLVIDTKHQLVASLDRSGETGKSDLVKPLTETFMGSTLSANGRAADRDACNRETQATDSGHDAKKGTVSSGANESAGRLGQDSTKGDEIKRSTSRIPWLRKNKNQAILMYEPRKTDMTIVDTQAVEGEVTTEQRHPPISPAQTEASTKLTARPPSKIPQRAEQSPTRRSRDPTAKSHNSGLATRVSNRTFGGGVTIRARDAAPTKVVNKRDGSAPAKDVLSGNLPYKEDGRQPDVKLDPIVTEPSKINDSKTVDIGTLALKEHPLLFSREKAQLVLAEDDYLSALDSVCSALSRDEIDVVPERDQVTLLPESLTATLIETSIFESFDGAIGNLEHDGPFKKGVNAVEIEDKGDTGKSGSGNDDDRATRISTDKPELAPTKVNVDGAERKAHEPIDGGTSLAFGTSTIPGSHHATRSDKMNPKQSESASEEKRMTKLSTIASAKRHQEEAEKSNQPQIEVFARDDKHGKVDNAAITSFKALGSNDAKTKRGHPEISTQTQCTESRRRDLKVKKSEQSRGNDHASKKQKEEKLKKPTREESDQVNKLDTGESKLHVNGESGEPATVKIEKKRSANKGQGKKEVPTLRGTSPQEKLSQDKQRQTIESREERKGEKKNLGTSATVAVIEQAHASKKQEEQKLQKPPRNDENPNTSTGAGEPKLHEGRSRSHPKPVSAEEKTREEKVTLDETPLQKSTLNKQKETSESSDDLKVEKKHRSAVAANSLIKSEHPRKNNHASKKQKEEKLKKPPREESDQVNKLDTGESKLHVNGERGESATVKVEKERSANKGQSEKKMPEFRRTSPQEKISQNKQRQTKESRDERKGEKSNLGTSATVAVIEQASASKKQEEQKLQKPARHESKLNASIVPKVSSIYVDRTRDHESTKKSLEKRHEKKVNATANDRYRDTGNATTTKEELGDRKRQTYDAPEKRGWLHRLRQARDKEPLVSIEPSKTDAKKKEEDQAPLTAAIGANSVGDNLMHYDSNVDDVTKDAEAEDMINPSFSFSGNLRSKSTYYDDDEDEGDDDEVSMWFGAYTSHPGLDWVYKKVVAAGLFSADESSARREALDEIHVPTAESMATDVGASQFSDISESLMSGWKMKSASGDGVGKWWLLSTDEADDKLK